MVAVRLGECTCAGLRPWHTGDDGMGGCDSQLSDLQALIRQKRCCPLPPGAARASFTCTSSRSTSASSLSRVAGPWTTSAGRRCCVGGHSRSFASQQCNPRGLWSAGRLRSLSACSAELN